MLSINKGDFEWSNGTVGADPIAHGSPAETFLVSLADTMIVSALWGAPTMWTSSATMPRGQSVTLSVVIPPFINRLFPFCVAAGKGTLTFTPGSVPVSVDLDDASFGIQSSGFFKATAFLETSGISPSAPCLTVTATASANVEVYSIGFFFDRDDGDLS
tara:strand:+ start:2795 stop:3271 length:477 start_codon:yes stop_codon:yes gene_type:complete